MSDAQIERNLVFQKISVSRETSEDLIEFVDILKKWTAKINLVAKSTLDDVWLRHILDSAQLYGHIPSSAKKLCDMGSGGGLPGIVIAILAKTREPKLEIELIEADSRKCAFLRQCSQKLNLNVSVTNARLEDAMGSHADIVTARALAPLGKLLSYGQRHLQENGHFLFLKGRNVQAELEYAGELWDFKCELFPSESDEDSSILKIRNAMER